MLDEKEYRNLVDQVFHRLGSAFESFDPDEAEFDLVMGSATIIFSDGAKCILSVQPSVRQVWLANASQGVAHHFDYDLSSQKWLDDKGKKIELLSYVQDLVRQKTGQELKL